TLFPIKYHTPLGAKSLSNVPPPIPIENFAANLKELSDKHGFHTLSQAMALLTVSEVEEKYRLTKVAALQNGSRNRYSDMVPYDQSLVLVGRPWSTVLKDQEPRITVSEVEKGYINASYVRRSEYGRRGEALVSPFTTLPEYIATQDPLESTVADFLTMVCEQRCPLIIMLSRHEEGGTGKCAQYWPNEVTQTFTSENYSVVVRNESEESSGNVIRRQLSIYPSGETSPWTVTQFQFMGWADHDVPNMESFYNLVIIHNNFLATHHVGNEWGPTVVHCSNGAGQTGTFMVACFLLDRLRKNPQNVDIIGTVLATRKWRTNLVQSWLQLQFLYNFVDFCIVRENFGVKSVASVAIRLPAAAPISYENLVNRPQPGTVGPSKYQNLVELPQPGTVGPTNYKDLVEPPQLGTELSCTDMSYKDLAGYPHLGAVESVPPPRPTRRFE
ncbi:Tyrosine-protein phosphatase non-receptor type 1, partial [Taenia solium]